MSHMYRVNAIPAGKTGDAAGTSASYNVDSISTSNHFSESDANLNLRNYQLELAGPGISGNNCVIVAPTGASMRVSLCCWRWNMWLHSPTTYLLLGLWWKLFGYIICLMIKYVCVSGTCLKMRSIPKHCIYDAPYCYCAFCKWPFTFRRLYQFSRQSFCMACILFL